MKRELGTATSTEALEREPGTVTSMGDSVSYNFSLKPAASEYRFICHWDKLFLKAREHGIAISMGGSGSELGTRGSQVIF